MKKIISILLLCISSSVVYSQDSEEVIILSLQEVIKLATDSSLSAFIAQNTYYAGYWNYRNFDTQKLPFLDFATTPVNFSRQVSQQYNFQDSSYYYVEEQTLSSKANLSLNQTIMKTGGNLYIDSDLGYLNNLNKISSGQYSSIPIRIGYNQQLYGFNKYKWLNLIEPLKFEKAKKQLIVSMEEISIRAVAYFFNMASAQINHEIAVTNLANADTLYSIGLKRFEISSIEQEDLFTLKLDLINSGNNVLSTLTDLRRAKMNLYSLLRLDNSLNIELKLPEDLPDLQLDPLQCLQLAMENNPDILGFMQQRLEADRDVEQAKKNSRLSANFNASFGLNQQGNDLASSYHSPLDQEIVRVGFNIPIVDWGLSRGEHILAQKNKDVIYASMEQAEVDFRQILLLTIEEFNSQERFVLGAAASDTIAQIVYDISKRRFMMGNTDIIKLSTSKSASITAKRLYINALETYWEQYYTIRKLTLFDFEKDLSLMKKFDNFVEIKE